MNVNLEKNVGMISVINSVMLALLLGLFLTNQYAAHNSKVVAQLQATCDRIASCEQTINAVSAKTGKSESKSNDPVSPNSQPKPMVNESLKLAQEEVGKKECDFILAKDYLQAAMRSEPESKEVWICAENYVKKAMDSDSTLEFAQDMCSTMERIIPYQVAGNIKSARLFVQNSIQTISEKSISQVPTTIETDGIEDVEEYVESLNLLNEELVILNKKGTNLPISAYYIALQNVRNNFDAVTNNVALVEKELGVEYWNKWELIKTELERQEIVCMEREYLSENKPKLDAFYQSVNKIFGVFQQDDILQVDFAIKHSVPEAKSTGASLIVITATAGQSGVKVAESDRIQLEKTLVKLNQQERWGYDRLFFRWYNNMEASSNSAESKLNELLAFDANKLSPYFYHMYQQKWSMLFDSVDQNAKSRIIQKQLSKEYSR